MRYSVFILLVLFLLSSCVRRSSSKTYSREESAMIVAMYSYIDTIDGHWRINISQEKAAELGISDSIYFLFLENIKVVNNHIDSIKKRDSTSIIGYNFPHLK